jgi:hypothetical protein
MKVIAFFVRLFSAGSELGLNQKFNRKSTEKLQNYFLVFSDLGPIGPGFGPKITRTSGK